MLLLLLTASMHRYYDARQEHMCTYMFVFLHNLSIHKFQYSGPKLIYTYQSPLRGAPVSMHILYYIINHIHTYLYPSTPRMHSKVKSVSPQA